MILCHDSFVLRDESGVDLFVQTAYTKTNEVPISFGSASPADSIVLSATLLNGA